MTLRCREDDLGVDRDSSFEDLARRFEIVKALQNKRCDTPEGGDTVGPEAGGATLYTLRYGHDHRGATWYDRTHEVVWLCGYGLHSSGQPDDAFQRFEAMREGDRIYPDHEDYVSLLRERDERFAEMLSNDAQSLLREARERAHEEVRGFLGGDIAASAVVHLIDTLSDTFVAFSVHGLTQERVPWILAAFYPERQFDDWVLIEELPTRELDVEHGEIAYRIAHDLGGN